MASVFVTKFDTIYDLWVLGAAWGLPPLAWPRPPWHRPRRGVAPAPLFVKKQTNPQVLQPMDKFKDKFEDGGRAKTEKALQGNS